MNIIKKTVPVLIIIILSVNVLSACGNNHSSKINSQNQNISQVKSNSSINSNHTEFVNTVSDVNRTFEIGENDILLMANTPNLRINSSSNIYDRYEVIVNTNEEIFSTNADNLDNISNVKILLSKEYYSEDSTGYKNLTDEIIFKYIGNLKIELNYVKYINYFDDEKVLPKQSWIKHFKNRMIDEYEHKTDTPIVIKESWTFEYIDKTVDIVTASNVLPTLDGKLYSSSFTDDIVAKNDFYGNVKDLPEIILPHGDNHILYEMTSIFVDGVIVYKDRISYSEISYYPISEQNKEKWVGISFVPPENDTNFQFKFYSYQSDDLSNIVKYPVFVDHTGAYNTENYEYSPVYFMLDTDFNNKMNILCYSPLIHRHTGQISIPICELQ